MLMPARSICVNLCASAIICVPNLPHSRPAKAFKGTPESQATGGRRGKTEEPHVPWNRLCVARYQAGFRHRADRPIQDLGGGSIEAKG
jgi:hypothetical protein